MASTLRPPAFARGPSDIEHTWGLGDSNGHGEEPRALAIERIGRAHFARPPPPSCLLLASGGAWGFFFVELTVAAEPASAASGPAACKRGTPPSFGGH